MARYKRTPPIERFMRLLVKHHTGCWIWQASRRGGNQKRGGNKKGVYPRFKLPNGKRGGVSVYAHRWLWEYMNGPIPDGMTLDHTCRVTVCVNPAHMEVITREDNTQRMHDARREKRRDNTVRRRKNEDWQPGGEAEF